jgi:hypothetical protein
MDNADTFARRSERVGPARGNPEIRLVQHPELQDLDEDRVVDREENHGLEQKPCSAEQRPLVAGAQFATDEGRDEVSMDQALS